MTANIEDINLSDFPEPLPVDGVYRIDINDIMATMQYKYALLLFILSAALFIYVLWNNFVRSPSKPIGFKGLMKEENWTLERIVLEDEGIEPSIRVKKVSRALDEYIMIPALVMVYISFSYLSTFW